MNFADDILVKWRSGKQKGACNRRCNKFNLGYNHSVEKRGIKISKTLIKAQFLCFITIIAVAIVSHLIVLQIPSSPFARISTFEQINHNNPQVITTQLYQDQSVLASRQDWLIFTPISYVVGGLVFGLILARSRKPLAIMGAGAGTSIVLSFIILWLSYAANYAINEIAQAGPYATRQPAPGLDYYGMGLLQTAYWTAIFVAGGLLGSMIRREKKAVGNSSLSAGSSVPATSTKRA